MVYVALLVPIDHTCVEVIPRTSVYHRPVSRYAERKDALVVRHVAIVEFGQGQRPVLAVHHLHRAVGMPLRGTGTVTYITLPSSELPVITVLLLKPGATSVLK